MVFIALPFVILLEGFGYSFKNCEVIILDTLVRPKGKSLYRKSKQGFVSSHKCVAHSILLYTKRTTENSELYGLEVAIEGLDILGVGTKIFDRKGANWHQNPFLMKTTNKMWFYEVKILI